MIMIRADARHLPLADESVQAVITSPPYWRHRDYGAGVGELGGEHLHDCLGWATGDRCGSCFVCHLVDVAAEVMRVLKPRGVFWLNIGDTYASRGSGGGGKWCGRDHPKHTTRRAWLEQSDRRGWLPAPKGLHERDLVGIPHRVALALQASGWIWRSDTIWAKPNPLPEGRFIRRPANAHEHFLMFVRRPDYYFNSDAIREPAVTPRPGAHSARADDVAPDGLRAARSVHTVPVSGYRGAHSAVMPLPLAERALLSSSRRDDVVLDPFAGSGTVGVAAIKHGRTPILIDLNEDYLINCAAGRLAGVQCALPLGPEPHTGEPNGQDDRLQ